MKLTIDIIELFELFRKSGYQLYIIGGAVRDYLLGREIEDYDLATNATPDEMIKILDGYKIDNYKALIGSIKVHLNDKIYEITTFRKEIGVTKLRYPKKIVFINNLEEDAVRRDFTINTLAYNNITGIVDCLNGIDDLKNKKIRFVKETTISLNEDPIRLIRALRFSLLLGFNIDVNDLLIFNNYTLVVSQLGKIRHDEIFKLFKINGCKEFILKYLNLYQNCYPELNHEQFINILKSDISCDLLKYIYIYFMEESNGFNLNKKDKLIVKGLKNIDVNNHDLYYTKLLMIEYKENLDVILELLKYLNNDITRLLENINLIKNKNHCLSVNELDISYLDLERLFINKKDYSKVFNFLLNEVLHNNELNKKEILIQIIKTQKGDF